MLEGHGYFSTRYRTILNPLAIEMASWDKLSKILNSLIDAFMSVVGAEGNSDSVIVVSVLEITEGIHGLKFEFQRSFHSVGVEISACWFKFIHVHLVRD